ncbi:MAG: hypothetical protein EKK47_21110 [Burkholderiales bacterium]|nr:MAG: hypothetical protein EKK47_21110 [Burkholderiales bacterium]
MKIDPFDHLVSQIYEAAQCPTHWPQVFELLRRQVSLDGWNLFRANRADDTALPVFFSIGGDAIRAGAQQSYLDYYFSVDPRTAFVRDGAPGQLFDCNRTFDQRYVSRNEFYQDFLIPEGLRYTLGSLACQTQQHDYVIGLLRGPDRGLFTGEDQTLVQRLLPHIQRSLRLMDSIQAQTQHASTAEQALATTPMAVIGIDRTGRLQHCNARAEKMLRDGVPVRMRHGRLVAADLAQRSALVAAIEQCARSSQPTSLLLLQDTPKLQRFSVTLMPTLGESILTGVSLPHSLLCLIAPLDRRRVATARQLIALFGLSPAEARLARAIAMGDTLESHAHAMGTKLTTVKTQFRSVLTKTGCDRQSSLVRLIAAIPVAREVDPIR